MMRITCLLIAVLMISPFLAVAASLTPAAPATFAEREAAWERHQKLDKSSPFQGLPWRCVGPVVQGGRLVDIEVVPEEPYTFYVAYASGGLWKTTNNGVSFTPLFDDQPTVIMGDVAIDPNEPLTVWVGTGENNSSRSSYGGHGVFRSDDGGLSWRHVGLGDADRIGRISIDPRNGDRVMVAALGKLYTDGGQRGVYRSNDGGLTWSQVLAGDRQTGFVDLMRDPSNPDVVYAAAWQRTRRPWEFTEGGEGSAIWKSSDGGDTWQKLTGGLPSGAHVGRIGLDIHTANPKIVYASIDNQQLLPEDEWDLGGGAVTAKRLRTMSKEDLLRQDPAEVESFLRAYDLDPTLDAATLLDKVRSDKLTIDDLLDILTNANASLFDTDIRGIEVWRSDDAGISWRRTHEQPLRQVVYTYGYYFGQIRVSPVDPDQVYVLGVPIIVSDDGGKSWRSLDSNNTHGDHQAMWIDPAHPRRLVIGNDGGLNMSFDGGSSWLALNAQEVGQLYAITVDMAEPYNIYGGLQDNGVMRGSSRWRRGSSPPWQWIGGGDGMYIQVDPRDGATYWGYQFGNYFRNNSGGGRERTKPYSKLKEPALRFNWQTPIQLSTHNHDILYLGANRLFRSMDQGKTWQAISPDLTASQERGDVPFATITTLAESSLRFGLIWAATDDGQVWLTEDGGVDWRNLSRHFAADRWVSRVEASTHDEKVAYVCQNGYRDDDIMPYLMRTDDLGETWVDISAGLPGEALNVVREDPVNPEVVYAGSDRGVYVSLDRGASWQALPGGLPNVPVHDLVVHPRDRELVAGTHGRSIWVVDVLPVQELTAEVREQAVYLFPKEEIQAKRSWKQRREPWFFREEEADKIEIPYWVRSPGTVLLTLRDDEDRVLMRDKQKALAGVNIFTWDLQLDQELAVAAEQERVAVVEEKGEELGNADTPWQEALRLGRPLYVTPGTYKLRADVGKNESEIELTVNEPEPLPPRIEKKPRIRAEKKDR
jgi:photosystem II stability/assembly factor-like uncharacterized protein